MPIENSTDFSRFGKSTGRPPLSSTERKKRTNRAIKVLRSAGLQVSSSNLISSNIIIAHLHHKNSPRKFTGSLSDIENVWHPSLLMPHKGVLICSSLNMLLFWNYIWEEAVEVVNADLYSAMIKFCEILYSVPLPMCCLMIEEVMCNNMTG